MINPNVSIKKVWDQIPAPLLLAGPDGQVVAMNRAATDLLGPEAPATLGKKAVTVPLGDGQGLLLVVPDQAEELREQFNLYKRALECHQECTMVVDPDARILLINHAYEKILGIRSEDVIGRHVTEVIENTRMHLVLETGVEEIGDIQRIRGQDAVVQRIPLYRNGRLVGGLGKVMFANVDEVKQLHERLRVLQSKVEYYESEMRQVASLQEVVGVSAKLRSVKDVAARAARTNADLLILGESGVGKELFANAVHQASDRAQGPLIKVNCAALPADLLEAELFGYAEGAFTGARKGGKPGKFELADSGTILLDEVGDMSLAMQAKVLRVLQEREVERVGGVRPMKVDVRVIAATNRDLEQMVKRGEFRLDLFYRLNVISLTIPPLRERPEDIPVLLNHYLHKLAADLRLRRKTFSPAAMAILVRYGWPGNGRELRNLVERLMHLVDSPEITPDDLPPNINRAGSRARKLPAGGSLPEMMAQTEKALLEDALERTGSNRVQAAALLGIPRSSLYEKLKKHGLE